MIQKINKRPEVLKDIGNNMELENTIFNHYETPIMFKKDCEQYLNQDTKGYIQKGIKAWNNFIWDQTQENIYKDVHSSVRSKLISRGFTSKMLYNTPEFTTERTGMLSKQRALMGMRDCYFKDNKVSEGNTFHDIFISLSYSYSVDQDQINEKAMSMYALTKELSRFIKVRVFIVNWVTLDSKTQTCYSYPVKRYGQPINKKEFVFFTSMSKRTYGWSNYETLEPHTSAAVGRPSNTVVLSNLDLDIIIDDIWNKAQSIIRKIQI